MRFIHTGDIHLGATPEKGHPWAESRGDEIWNTFERLIMEIKNNPVDLLIIAGDLFHRQPLLRELKEVDYLFSTIPMTKIVLCAGNHDAIKKGSFYETYNWSENVIFVDSKNVEEYDIPELNTCVYGLSYYTTENRDAMYDHVIVNDPDKINILMAHGGDEKHIPINTKRVAMSGFDYVAMGHIHKPYINESTKMAYCGSLEPIDKNDLGDRGYIYGEVDKEGLELKFVPFAKRIYLDMEFPVTPVLTNMEIKSRLTDAYEEHGKDNMYRIIFNGYRDPEFELDVNEIMNTGNVVDVVDNTVPDYDFEELYEDNKDNILGMFIEKYINKNELTPVEEKTLYYGTKALLDAMEDRI